MTRTAAALIGGSLAALGATVAFVGTPNAVPEAEAHDKRQLRIVANHDGIHTWATITGHARTIDCIKIATQDTGWPRKVTIHIDGMKVINARPLRKGERTRCLVGRKVIKTAKNSPVILRVVEDMPGPINPSDTTREILR
jgi:hypothetical protein